MLEPLLTSQKYFFCGMCGIFGTFGIGARLRLPSANSAKLPYLSRERLSLLDGVADRTEGDRLLLGFICNLGDILPLLSGYCCEETPLLHYKRMREGGSDEKQAVRGSYTFWREPKIFVKFFFSARHTPNRSL